MQTKDICLIERIKGVLDFIYGKEKEVLSNYRNYIWPYYYEMNGVSMPLDD